jgi:hypothetical protein
LVEAPEQPSQMDFIGVGQPGQHATGHGGDGDDETVRSANAEARRRQGVHVSPDGLDRQPHPFR